MRRRYIVSYDISDEKRLRLIFKVMRDFGDHIQYSVFFCELNHVERIRMEMRIKDVINEREDQILIVDLGKTTSNLEDQIFYVVGKPLIFQSRAKIV